MRMITEQAVAAMGARRNFKSGNTLVIQRADGSANLLLYDKEIAILGPDGLWITNAGHPTRTTYERLNGLPGVQINVSRGKTYLNGKEWNGRWIKTEP